MVVRLRLLPLLLRHHLEEFSNLFGLAKEDKDAVNKTKHCVYVHTFSKDDQKQRMTAGYVADQFKEVTLTKGSKSAHELVTEVDALADVF